MVVQVLQGVKIQINIEFRDDCSDIERHHYFFDYHITIENQNNFKIQLLERSWDIFDSLGAFRHVEGKGVVGEQPLIKAGGSYAYTSSCNLVSDFGAMKGSYTFINPVTNTKFTVPLPVFELWVPWRKS